MACQTGIRANEELLKFFNDCKLGKIRLAKIIVKNEELCLNYQDAGSNDWRTDFKKFLPDCVDSYEPCFILFRLTAISWLFISFADDRAPVREKMVLAATRSTFKSEFGQSNIRYEYHVTNKNELNLETFEQWMNSKEEGPFPMSDLEKELESAYKEAKTYNHAIIAAQTLKGVVFPMDRDAEDELRKLRDYQVNYVQLSVDTLNEAIKLECSKMLDSTDELRHVIPRDKPRYHFYRLTYEYNDQELEKLFFIYSMPSFGCTIKEKMLYSSCKSPFLQSACNIADVKPDKKIEIDSKEILSTEALVDYVHPAYNGQEKIITKPPGPTRRGNRRIIKTNV